MYHNIVQSSSLSAGLSVSENRLNEQFEFLVKNNYTTYHFSELKKIILKGESISKKSVVITFDDVYLSQLNLAYPLIRKHKLKATFFIPFAFVGKKDSWNTNKEEIMSIEQLKSLNSDFIEFGWHSFSHGNYKHMPLAESQRDLELCENFITHHELRVENVMAYPYGKYPRKSPTKEVFFETLAKKQIDFGLRIGNRVNSFPFKNNFEIQRIDIKGEDSLMRFNLKLKFGKLKLF